VVFVHGWSSTGQFWDHTLRHLPSHGRTFTTVDLRGHGDSAAKGLDHSVQRYAEDILSVADDAGFERFVTVAHSMGAKYAQYLRILAPERLLGQIAITPTPSTSAEGTVAEEDVSFMAGKSGDPDAMVELFGEITKHPLPEKAVRPLAEAAAGLSGEVLAHGAPGTFVGGPVLPKVAPRGATFGSTGP
jgi:pimeloyl-ACP methyl ester carboxylesterase